MKGAWNSVSTAISELKLARPWRKIYILLFRIVEIVAFETAGPIAHHNRVYLVQGEIFPSTIAKALF